MQKHLTLFVLLILCVFAGSIMLDIARYFRNGMPNYDFYVLPGGILLLMIVSPIIYGLSKDLLKERRGP